MKKSSTYIQVAYRCISSLCSQTTVILHTHVVLYSITPTYEHRYKCRKKTYVSYIFQPNKKELLLIESSSILHQEGTEAANGNRNLSILIDFTKILFCIKKLQGCWANEQVGKKIKKMIEQFKRFERNFTLPVPLLFLKDDITDKLLLDGSITQRLSNKLFGLHYLRVSHTILHLSLLHE